MKVNRKIYEKRKMEMKNEKWNGSCAVDENDQFMFFGGKLIMSSLFSFSLFVKF